MSQRLMKIISDNENKRNIWNRPKVAVLLLYSSSKIIILKIQSGLDSLLSAERTFRLP